MADEKQVTVKINERDVQVAPGTLVIEATRRIGIEVPSFCYYGGLALQAACRMCLVEVEKMPKMQTACTLVATEGMIVRTDTPQIHAARKGVLEFLLTNHPLDCPVCDKGGECELQDMVFRYGADASRFVEEKIHVPEEKWSEAVYYDAPRCILCFRCVRVCDEGMGVKALGVGSRGVNSVIFPNSTGANGDARLDCVECGMCIDICPVGALTSGTYRYKTRPWEMKYEPTICTHCSNGCKVTHSVRNNEILRANNRDLSGINGDFLCTKGRFGFDFIKHAERIREPLVRRNGKFETASWEDAIAEVAKRLAEIQKKSKGSIGFIGSNRTSNEENYLLQRLARASFNTNNIDHHRTADYTGLVTSLGDKTAAASATMQQLGNARAILLIANDPANQSPLVAWQMRAAFRHHRANIYVINSREEEFLRTAAAAVKVGDSGEASAVRWLATGQGSVQPELSALKDALAKESDVIILFGAQLTGAAIRDLIAYGSALQGHTRYMALGDYMNSRGAADMGILPDRLPGYAPVSDSATLKKFGDLWGAKLPDKRGMTAQEMLTAAQTGSLKALYVVGANPVRTFRAKEIKGDRLGKLEFLCVHEMFMTETAKLADVIFPAASAYEKDGTVTNTAGEIQRLHRALDPMGPRTDFDLLRFVSHQLAKLGVGKAIVMRSPEAVFEEIRANVPGYDVALPALLTGGAPISKPRAALNGHSVAPGAVFSAHDDMFTSGSLSKYFTLINSLAEARRKP